MDLYWYTCQDCTDLGPPPDMILTIPPPPMPMFLGNSLLGFKNRTNAPCPLLCDWTTGQEVDMIKEFPHIGTIEEHKWFILTHFVFLIMLFFATLTSVLLLKYRQRHKLKSCVLGNMYNDRTRSYESIVYPSIRKNKVLWATLHHKGKPTTVSYKSIPPPLLSQTTRTSNFENTDRFSSTKFSNVCESSWRLKASLNIPSLYTYSRLHK